MSQFIGIHENRRKGQGILSQRRHSFDNNSTGIRGTGRNFKFFWCVSFIIVHIIELNYIIFFFSVSLFLDGVSTNLNVSGSQDCCALDCPTTEEGCIKATCCQNTNKVGISVNKYI